MRLLLVNPNTYQKPPVIPIGLEYLITTLRNKNHEVKLLDLCFEENPLAKLEECLNSNSYDLVGFTIRNIDSCIYFNNEFFLPEIKKLIEKVNEYSIPVIIGGAGFSANPEDMLNYLKADYGIEGPAELAMLDFLEDLENIRISQKIYNGWAIGINDSIVNLRGNDVDYKTYISEDGIVGFQTHVGCDGKCPYCIEAGTTLIYKKIPPVIEEIKYLVGQGFNHYHLCDSEFNNDLTYSIEFCKALIQANLSFKWTLYMKPVPYKEELFRLLSETNAYLITLSIDSDERIQKMNGYSYDDLEIIFALCKKYEIELAIDLLVGYPKEPIESVQKMIAFLKKHRPEKVGISFYYRLSKGTILGKLIQGNKDLQKMLTVAYSKNSDFIEPTFYSQVQQEDILNLIADDEIFSIAGIKQGVNYQL